MVEGVDGVKMLSLFSGIGGIDLAAAWAGIETVAMCEIDDFCCNVLKKHWPNKLIYKDIKNLSKEVLNFAGIKSINVIAGGFPCQPYSEAGNRKGNKDDRHLWPEMFRLIKEIKPRWVVGENVTGFIELGVDDAITDLESEGYTTETFVLPACSVKAPHQRDRVFMVAYLPSVRLPDSDKHSKLLFKNTKSDTGTWNKELLAKPSIPRVVDGIPSKLDKDRLKACGNAVVPQQIYPIFKAIMDIEYGE